MSGVNQALQKQSADALSLVDGLLSLAAGDLMTCRQLRELVREELHRREAAVTAHHVNGHPRPGRAASGKAKAVVKHEANGTAHGKPGRKPMTEAQRKAVSKRMKAAWAKRKRAKQTA
jgi:hypothetical protein